MLYKWSLGIAILAQLQGVNRKMHCIEKSGKLSSLLTKTENQRLNWKKTPKPKNHSF